MNPAFSGGSCLAVLGTGSDVGKSIVVTALCRLFADQGIRVAPFKAQNMSNNSGVTPEGLEMGRAQIVQAEAARLSPHVDMNPVLLKPTSEKGSQVVVRGIAAGNQSAMDYHRRKAGLVEVVHQSLDRLRRDYDLVILEGAGSCAEVNLMAHDIVNFSMAEYADAPVILVGDIHRGGIFGQLIGTLACLPPHFRNRVAGFIINRFRGDARLFADGVRWIEDKTGLPVFGVLPWYDHIRIDSEDSVAIERPDAHLSVVGDGPAVAVIRLPHISNFTDIDPLQEIPGLGVNFVKMPRDLSAFAAVILPGSKNTRFDLNWLKSTGWASRLTDYQASGGFITGICGGYQMLGTTILDPDGLEGKPGTSEGLGLLPVKTLLKAPKTTTLTQFSWEKNDGAGYEIHMGQTTSDPAALVDGRPLLTVHSRNGMAAHDMDGCITHNGRVMGTYIHGFFDSPAIIRHWLFHVGIQGITVPDMGGLAARSHQYDALADHFQRHVNVAAIGQLVHQ
ncbi:cobyric acid synthase [Desulfosarcina sp. OttesenSCG-928-A07]|nr:cobyric acid synthase [Desulfosarcina sp. OttesenSCG-928-G17]MDL2329107.1 cobyric acid synthase [Desulfosarcina sp. OttesenSCG-928-A07]